MGANEEKFFPATSMQQRNDRSTKHLSLQDEVKLKDFVETQQFRCGWNEGFDYLSTSLLKPKR
jgi:hypothetical protein